MGTYEAAIARAFRLDRGGWARHANPWSGWTRFATCLPLLVLAIWSRTWIGWWSILPIALALLWIAVNPHAFPPPADDRHWMTRAVMGERHWTRRDERALPARHRLAPHLLAALAGSGLPFLVYGLWRLEVWPTLVGLGLVIVGKLWFCDRMVWIYDDMVREDPGLRYRGPDPA